MRSRWWVLFPFTLLTMVVLPLLAQENCPTLVQEALNAIDDQCAGLDRNSACYGYKRVEASFTEPVADDFFARPSDRTPVLTLAEIATAPLAINRQEWGVAVLDLQADLPDALPGQSVVFILLGDVEVENAVIPENAAQPINPLEVTTITSVNVRSGPGLNFNRVGIAQNEQTLAADGLDSTGEWLRVVFNNGFGWISRELVNSTADLAQLPTISPERRTPMQAFYLRTGIGQPACDEAPQDTLLIQSPENLKIHLNVNGAEIEVGSTIVLRTHENGDNAVMELIVIDGQAKVLSDAFTTDRITIREGERAEVCLTPEQDLGIAGLRDDRLVGCRWSTPTRADLTEFCSLRQINPAMLHYPIVTRCADDPTPTPVPQEVRSTPAITPQATPSRVNCAMLQRQETTSRWYSRLEWTPADGADEYKVNVYNYVGEFVTSHWLRDGTFWVLDLRAFNLRRGFQWEVEALREGVSYCNTNRSVMYDTPTEPEPTPVNVVVTGSNGFGAILFGCLINTTPGPLLSTQEAKVRWSNGNAGDTVTVTVVDNIGFSYTRTGSGTSGEVTFTSLGSTHRFNANPFIVTTSSGLSAVAPPCP